MVGWEMTSSDTKHCHYLFLLLLRQKKSKEKDVINGTLMH